MTVYDFNPGFFLQRLVEIPTAQWRDDHWAINAAIERTFDEKGGIITRPLTANEVKAIVTPSKARTSLSPMAILSPPRA